MIVLYHHDTKKPTELFGDAPNIRYAKVADDGGVMEDVTLKAGDVLYVVVDRDKDPHTCIVA